MDQQKIATLAAELRVFAKRMRENVYSSPNATRLKSLSANSGRHAARLLANVFDCVPEWSVVIRALLQQQNAKPSALDESARKLIQSVDDDEPFYIYHEQIPEIELDEHYVAQAVRWARLLDNAAAIFETNSGLSLPSCDDDGPYPPNSWKHQGKLLPTKMSDRAWKLVSFLWAEDKHSAHRDDIADNYNEAPELISLADWSKDANDFFRQCNLQWSITKSGGTKEPRYTLLNLAPKPSRKKKST